MISRAPCCASAATVRSCSRFRSRWSKRLRAPAPAAGPVTLQGSGASFPAPLYSRWFREFGDKNKDVKVNYQSTGSGAGMGMRSFNPEICAACVTLGETTGAVAGIQSICATIQQVDEISAAIAAAVGQQGTATQEIAQNVQQAAARTGEVSQNIAGVTDGIAATGTAEEEVLVSAIELSKQSQRLRDEVDRFLAQIRAA